MLSYQFGDIVMINSLLDSQGRNPKDRPAVVIGSRVNPDGSTVVRVMAITTFVPDPLPAYFVLLPWSLPKHPRTGLNKRNAAVAKDHQENNFPKGRSGSTIVVSETSP